MISFILLSLICSISGQTILDVVSENFTELANLATAASVDVSALGTPGTFTLFAPNDMAITNANLPTGPGAPTAEEIIFSHVLDATLNATSVLATPTPAVLTPLSGNKTRLNIYSGTGFSGAICINSAQVVTPDFRGALSNGIIHEVDEVIIPAWRTYLDVVTALSLTKLASVVTQIDDATVNSILSQNMVTDQAYTVFAPTDAAFMALENQLNVSDITDLDNALLLRVILGHVVPAAFYSKAFTSTAVTAQTASTDDSISIVSDNGVKITSSGGVTATVTGADATVFNGVAHVIDQVLLPPLTSGTTSPSEAPEDSSSSLIAISLSLLLALLFISF